MLVGMLVKENLVSITQGAKDPRTASPAARE
jgi:hypothetical protein